MKKFNQLLKEFDDAARHWGYISDQGSGGKVRRAEMAYDEAKASLEIYVKKLWIKGICRAKTKKESP